jgi:16S rRNA C1402 N4-methylase RsmH
VQVAVETLKKTTEEKDQFAKSVAEKSIASRESLWAETSPKLKTKTTEVTDLIESSVFSIKATGKFAKDIIIDFFQAIRIA